MAITERDILGLLNYFKKVQELMDGDLSDEQVHRMGVDVARETTHNQTTICYRLRVFGVCIKYMP